MCDTPWQAFATPQWQQQTCGGALARLATCTRSLAGGFSACRSSAHVATQHMQGFSTCTGSAHTGFRTRRSLGHATTGLSAMTSDECCSRLTERFSCSHPHMTTRPWSSRITFGAYSTSPRSSRKGPMALSRSNRPWAYLHVQHTVKYSTVRQSQHSPAQCSTAQCSALQNSTGQHSTQRWTAWLGAVKGRVFFAI
jgi:hypothetical protein